MSALVTRPATGAVRGLDRQVVRLLARPRTAVDRMRARATAAASAGTGVALLLFAAIAGLGDDPATTGRYVLEAADGSLISTASLTASRGLVTYVADPGLRPGVQLAALLLVLPFAALAAQALRVGAVTRQEREATLVVAGASQRDLRRVRVVSTAAAALRGALWAGPAYLLLWLLLGLAPPPGARLVPKPELWLLLVWVALVGLLAVAGAAAGVLLGRRGASSRPAPRARWAWLAGVGAAVCAGGIPAAASVEQAAPRGLRTLVDLALLLGALLCLAVCAVVVLARAAVRSSTRRVDRAARSGSGAEVVLAAAQRRGNPVAVGASGAVVVLVGVCLGACTAFGTAMVVSRDFYGNSSDAVFYGSGVVLACAVAGVAAAVALVSLALALTDHLGQARRAVAATAALGCDVPRLVEVQARALAATAVPSAVTGTLVGGSFYAGLLIAVDWSWVGPRTLVPVGAVLVAAVVVGAAVRLVCCAVAELLTGRVRRAAALENLRTP